MGCSENPQNDNYDFFDNIDDYIQHAEEFRRTVTLDNIPEECNSFSAYWENNLGTIETAKDMCKQFLKLYKSLYCYREDIQNTTTKINDCKFLNYWVNWKLNISKKKENICVKNFYEDVVNHCDVTFLPSSTFNLKYNINNNDLKKMNKLYTLYQNYHKLNSILSTTSSENLRLLLETSTQCLSEYNLARSMCYDENDKFCEKLRNFKSKYKTLYVTVQDKGEDFSKNFKRLPEENSNIISSALIGSIVGLIPLFGLLYKIFRPAQLFKSKKSKFTNGHNNNDEMRNITLMDQEIRTISSQKERYNIKYHSVGKS